MSEKILYFDTETNGYGSFKDLETIQDLIQLGWIYKGKRVCYFIQGTDRINPEVPHNITLDDLRNDGLPFIKVWAEFWTDFQEADTIVAHNIKFDTKVLLKRLMENTIDNTNEFQYKINNVGFCTMSYKKYYKFLSSSFKF